MPVALTDADRAFLSQEWRYVEASHPTIKAAQPGAREADRPSPFLTAAGATAVLTVIDGLLSDDNRSFVATVQGIVTVNFAGKTPNFTLFANRFDLSAGRTMICIRAVRDWTKMRTVLYLWG